jgi:hypothetical protein
MASGDRQSEVIDLIVRQCGLAREKVHLSSRLLQDFDIEGDDAVEFFDSVHGRFGTDLTVLYEHWSEHFGSEGFSSWNGLIFIPAGLIAGVIAGAAGLGNLAGFAIAVVLIVACYWAILRWGPPDTKTPVTVGDVVAAVEAGAWPARPQA